MTLVKLSGSQSEAKRCECGKRTSGRGIKRVGKRVTRMFEIVLKFSEIYKKERKEKTPPFPSSKG